MNELDSNKVTDLRELRKLLKKDFSGSVVFENNDPLSWQALKKIRETGGSFKRIGFRTWKLSPPLSVSNIDIEKRSNKATVFARAAILIALVLLCLWEASAYLTTLASNWPQIEKFLKDYPFLSAILSGAILLLPFGLFYKWSIKFIQEYLGLNR
jgi:hypothetical protein